MLQHPKQESAPKVSQSAGSPTHSEPAATVTPISESSWRALYRTYVTDNPVYWKETNRPELSTLTPKLRAKALVNREKREADPNPGWRNLKEWLLALAILAPVVWSVSHFMAKMGVPAFMVCLSPLFGALGMGAQLTRLVILEREKRTWNALMLSHLTPAQILLGKLLPWLRQIVWLELITLLFIVPSLWQGTMPLWPLLMALPLLLTAPLPGGLKALRVGLYAPSMERGMAQASRCIVLPTLMNLLAALTGVAGILACDRISYPALPVWLPALVIVPYLAIAINFLWARRLWRGLLRDFHNAPGDFSG